MYVQGRCDVMVDHINMRVEHAMPKILTKPGLGVCMNAMFIKLFENVLQERMVSR